MPEINNTDIYLERLAKPLQEKLRVAKYIPEGVKNVLDVGCADGTVTIEMAKMFPEINFKGIDLKEEFIKKANERAREEELENVDFETVYLRDMLNREERFDSVVFVSVLHEFFTYGEGVSSVLKAVSDAHELLHEGGNIIIRDMILHEYAKHATLNTDSVLDKIKRSKRVSELLKDFENCYDSVDNLYKLNHFLLKYFYEENWERECREHYVPVTFEQYKELFALLGMDIQLQDSYLIEFLKNKWVQDFKLTEEELSGLRSTGFIVARK